MKPVTKRMIFALFILYAVSILLIISGQENGFIVFLGLIPSTAIIVIFMQNSDDRGKAIKYGAIWAIEFIIVLIGMLFITYSFDIEFLKRLFEYQPQSNIYLSIR